MYNVHLHCSEFLLLQGPIVGRDPDERLSIRRDKNHVLFGGTKILQHTPDKVAAVMLSLKFVITFGNHTLRFDLVGKNHWKRIEYFGLRSTGRILSL